MPLKTPVLKPIVQVLEEVGLRQYLEQVTQEGKPIIKIGRFLMLDGPHNPGPSLLNKPRCIAWNSIVHGSWATEDDLKDTTYGEAVHRAFFDWFVKYNNYEVVQLEPHIVISRVSARPDIVYCNDNNECGIIEVKSFGLDATKVRQAREQLAVYAYMLSQFATVEQAWLVLRDAVLPMKISELIELGRELFEVLRRLPREPPEKPYNSCHRCPFARVCLVRKPVLVEPQPQTPNPLVLVLIAPPVDGVGRLSQVLLAPVVTVEAPAGAVPYTLVGLGGLGGAPEALINWAPQLQPAMASQEVKQEKQAQEKTQPTIRRISLGVEWLDYALQGGVPRGTWTLVTGEPGTGKSILAIQAVGANVDTIPVVLVSTETRFYDVVRQGSQFGIDLSDAVSLADVLAGRVKDVKTNLVVIDLFGLARQYRELLRASEEEGEKKARARSPLSMEVVLSAIEKAYEVLGVTEEGGRKDVLVVIDSLAPLWAHAPAMARLITYGLRQRLYRPSVTVLMTNQYAPTTGMTFGFGAEHIADAIIHMWFESVETTKEIRRWLIIKKARLTNHYRKAMRFEVEPGRGLTLLEPGVDELRKWASQS
jgi:KaiC domain protein